AATALGARGPADLAQVPAAGAARAAKPRQARAARPGRPAAAPRRRRARTVRGRSPGPPIRISPTGTVVWTRRAATGAAAAFPETRGTWGWPEAVALATPAAEAAAIRLTAAAVPAAVAPATFPPRLSLPLAATGSGTRTPGG